MQGGFVMVIDHHDDHYHDPADGDGICRMVVTRTGYTKRTGIYTAGDNVTQKLESNPALSCR